MKEKLTLKSILIALFVILVLGAGGYGGYRLLNKEKAEENEKNNTSIEPAQVYTISNLGNGWKLLKNELCGYSIEIPTDWYTNDITNSSLTILNKNPEEGPYIGVATPDDLLELKIVSMSKELNYSENQEISISGYYPGEELIVVHGLKEYYEKLFSYDVDTYRRGKDIDITKHFPVQEITINGQKAKKAYGFGENGISTNYHFPVYDYNDIIKLYFFHKEIESVSEYEHMLDSFKVL